MKFTLLLLFILFYSTAFSQKGGLSPVMDSASGMWGYKKELSESFSIKPIFSKAYPFFNGNAVVEIAKGFSIIDEKGKFRKGVFYDEITFLDNNLSSGFTLYRKGSKWGVLSLKGKQVTEPLYDSALVVDEEAFAVLKGRSWFLINSKGRKVGGKMYDEILPSGLKSFALVQKNMKWGLVKSNGEEKIPCLYKEVVYLGQDRFAVKNHKGNYAIFSADGSEVYPHTLDSIRNFSSEGYAVAFKHYLSGLIDENGDDVIPFENKCVRLLDNALSVEVTPFDKWTYEDLTTGTKGFFWGDSVSFLKPGFFTIYDDKGIYVVDSLGQVGFFEGVTHLELFHDDCLIFEEKGKFGLARLDGKVVIPAKYSAISLVGDFILAKALKTEVFAYDFDGNLLNNISLHSSKGFEFPLLSEKGQGYFFVNERFKKVKEVDFQWATPFKNKRAIAKYEGFFGVLNQDLEWIISPVLDTVILLNSNVFLFENDGDWGTVDEKGFELYRDEENEYFVTENGLFEVLKAEKKGLLSPFGHLLLLPIYDSVSIDFDKSIGLGYLGNHQFFAPFDKKTSPKPDVFDNLSMVYGFGENGLAVAKDQSGKFGYVDYLGRWTVPPRYDSAVVFSEGCAFVKLGGLWGIINEFNRIVIQPKYESASFFGKDSKAIVKKNGKFGVIDKKGEVILSFKYDFIEKNRFNNWKVKTQLDVGVYSNDGLVGIYPKYEDVEDLGNGWVVSYNNGLKGLDDIHGTTYKLPSFDEIIPVKGGNSVFLFKVKKEGYEKSLQRVNK